MVIAPTAMAGSDRGQKAAGFLLLLGLLIRVAVAEVMLGHGFHKLPDSWLYERYAQAIFHGEPYAAGTDEARRMPGYPTFLALCWHVTGEPSDRAVLYAQALAWLIGTWAAFGLAGRMELHGWPNGTALAALALITLDPYSITLCSMVLSETIFAIFLILCALCALTAQERESRESWWWSLMVGITFAVAVLLRPSGLLLGPAAGLLWWVWGERKLRIARILAAAGLGFLLTISPWWIRNTLIFETFVPLTLNVGESLYDGLNPQATGASDMSFEQDPSIRNLPELERDQIWRSRAIDWVRDHSGRAVELAGIKFRRFWSPWPNESKFRSVPVLILTTLGTVPVWILAFWAAWAFRANRGTVALCLLPILYFCGIHLVLVSSVRYRVPAMPMLELLAGAGLVLAARKVQSHRHSRESGNPEGAAMDSRFRGNDKPKS